MMASLVRTALTVNVALCCVGQAELHSAVTTSPKLPVMCQKNVGGTDRNYLIFIYFDPNDPNNTNHDDWGDYTTYSPPDSTKKNCADEPYTYSKITGSVASWSVVKCLEVVLGQPCQNFTFNAVDNDRYWDWYYTGYIGGAANSCDYAKNCHGYAFDVDDWPGNEEGVGKIVKAGTCYITASVKNATHAVSEGWGHSIKVTGDECAQDEEPPVQVHITSSEKFKESGVYTQDRSCPDGGVDLNKAHSTNGGTEYDFILYKKKP
jgi:hypothetical protein